MRIGDWHCSGVFFVNFEFILYINLVFLFLTLNMSLPFRLTTHGIGFFSLELRSFVQSIVTLQCLYLSKAANLWCFEKQTILSLKGRQYLKYLQKRCSLFQLRFTGILLHKNELSIQDFFSKYDQIRRKLRIWSHLLKKSSMENLIFGQCLSPN